MPRDVADVLQDWGVVTPELLARAREIQARSGKDLREILIELRVDSLGVYAAWAELLGMEFIDLERTVIDSAVVRLVPEVTSRQYCLIPVGRDGDVLVLAVGDPANTVGPEAARSAAGSPSVRLLLTDPDAIRAAIDRHLPSSRPTLADPVTDLGGDRTAALKAKAYLAKVRFIDVSAFQIDPEAVALVPAHLARQYQVIPLARRADQVVIAMADPTDIFASQAIGSAAEGFKITSVLGDSEAIAAAIETFYGPPQ